MNNFAHSLNGEPFSLPNRIKFIIMAWNPFALIGTLLTIQGLVFVIGFGSVTDFKSPTYSDSDPMAQGLVTHITKTNSSHGKEAVYEYHYEFVLNPQTTKIGGTSYSSTADYKEGDSVQIQYTKDNYNVSRIKGMENQSFPWWILLILSTIPILGVLLLANSIKKGLKKVKTIENGQMTDGTFTHNKRTMLQVNRQYVYQLFYEFKARDGLMYTASYKTHKSHLIANTQSQKLIYDINNPSISVVLAGLPTQAFKYVLTNWPSN